MSNLVELEVKSVALVHGEGGVGMMVILKERYGSRHLPIVVGPFEGKAISMALSGETFSRPLTHDLLYNVIETLGARIEKVVINDLVDGTFYARLILNREGEVYSIDARPSDAMALALKAKAPIFASSTVMDSASEYLPDLEEGEEGWGEDLGG